MTENILKLPLFYLVYKEIRAGIFKIVFCWMNFYILTRFQNVLFCSLPYFYTYCLFCRVPNGPFFVAVFRRASADGHLFNPNENGHLPNSSFGPFTMMIGKNINKICHLLMTLLCILAFLSLTFVSLTQLLSKDVGTIVRVETGPEHPDMTLCSFGYNTRNYSELITQLPHPDYTLNDTRWVLTILNENSKPI